MEIFEGHRGLSRALRAPAVALGNFDGVHVGHQALLARVRQRSGAGEAVVFTFEPHPAKVLAPSLAPPLLTSPARKLELLAAAGIDACIVEPFTRELAALSPDQFHDILLRNVGARHLVVGYDFSYGRGRSGTTDSLAKACASAGVGIDVIEPVAVDGLVASSTKIREFVEEGNMPGAAVLLGRPFEAEGTVVRGAGRGRTIGIPTANVATVAELLPPTGVYAVWLEDRATGERRPGAANLGVNPTFQDQGSLSLEVHVLDFDGDLYGHQVRVQFAERLRGEKKFAGPAELVAQIREDIDRARGSLTGAAS